ncbi:MAG: nuclear transport factor 2 family protein [Mucilaginibacter sp.]|nr:nuclear transport factor 2 family protein [Mucilaginibacter sp.]
MKINTILKVALFLVMLTGCRQDKKMNDPQLLKKVVASYFEGIENKDFTRMKAATTTDFILYEDGEVWNNDSAFVNIKAHLPFTVKYTLKDFKIFVDDKSGDMTYLNHADFVFSGTKRKSFDWIESATFRKIDGVWKMNFLQLTERR